MFLYVIWNLPYNGWYKCGLPLFSLNLRYAKVDRLWIIWDKRSTSFLHQDFACDEPSAGDRYFLLLLRQEIDFKR